MVPLISFDAFVNLYLTIIFIIPLRRRSFSPAQRKIRRTNGMQTKRRADVATELYSYKNMPRTPATIRLRSVAFRTFGGAVCSLISSITYVSVQHACAWKYQEIIIKKNDSNLSVLMSLDGEPGWMCLMCCNCDSELRFLKPGSLDGHVLRYHMADIGCKFYFPQLSSNG